VQGRVQSEQRLVELSYDDPVGFVTGLPSIVALLAESHPAHRDVTPAVRALQLALAELIDTTEEAVARLEQVEAEQPEDHQQAVSAPISRVAAPRPSTSAGCSTVVQPRVKAGQQLRRTLKQILSLEGAGKLSAARELGELAQTELDCGTRPLVLAQAGVAQQPHAFTARSRSKRSSTCSR
jgi:hypothetical protein